MNENSYLNPGIVKASCRQFISQLESEKSAYNNLRKKTELFVNNRMKGESITALKMQLNNYSVILGTLSLANDSDIDDSTTMINSVGDEILIGRNILLGKEKASKDQRDNGNNASKCYENAYKATDEDMITYWNSKGNFYDNLARMAGDRYSYFCDKERKYDEINDSISNLFQKSINVRAMAKGLLEAMDSSYVNGVYDDSKCFTIRTNLQSYYDDNKLSLLKDKYIYGSAGRMEKVVDLEALSDILSKDVEDITPEEWEAIVEASYYLKDDEIDDLVTAFIDVKYNDSDSIQIGVDVDKYNTFLKHLKYSYYGNIINGYTSNYYVDISKTDMYLRYLLLNDIPVNQIQNNEFDFYEDYRLNYNNDSDYLKFVKSILFTEAADYIPRIVITTDYLGKYTISVYPRSGDDLDCQVSFVDLTNTDERGKRIAGLDRSFVSVVMEDNVSLSYGGDQDWFASEDEYIKLSGCGAIAAVNTYLYIAGITSISKDDYMEYVRDYVNNYLPSYKMLELELGADPYTMGKFIEDKLKEQGIKVDTNWLEYDSKDQWDKMEKMLVDGKPVIWGIFDFGSVDKTIESIIPEVNTFSTSATATWLNNNLGIDVGNIVSTPISDLTGSHEDGVVFYKFDSSTGEYVGATGEVNSHYVTVTGLIEQKQEDGSTRRMVEISSWGKVYYVDYDQYLDEIKEYDSVIEQITAGWGSTIMEIK